MMPHRRLIEPLVTSELIQTKMKKLTEPLSQTLREHRDRWTIVAVIILSVVVFSPVLGAGFVLIDDHGILRITSSDQMHPQSQPIPTSAWGAITTEDIPQGRVRLSYHFCYYGLITLLGTNAFAWHLVILAIGVTSVCSLYAALRKVQIPIVPSFLFVLLVLFAANSSLTWIKLGPAETWGTLFTCFALFAGAQASTSANPRYWDIILFLSALLAGLAKESFVLVIPALLYARVVLWGITWRQTAVTTLRANKFIIIALMLNFLINLMFVLFVARSAGDQSYGGISLASNEKYLQHLATVAFAVLWQGGFFLPVALMVISLRPRQRMSNSVVYVFLGSVFCGMWILPQLLLYATRDGMAGFYWLPAIIGIAAANALALAWLARANVRFYMIGVAWIALCIVLFSGVTYIRASRFRADAAALNRMLDYLTQSVGYGKTIAIAAEPARNYEATLSLIAHLGSRGRIDIPVALLPVHDSSYSSQFSGLGSALENYFVGHNALTDTQADQVDAIVLLVSEESLPPEWYAKYKSSARPIEFSETAFYPTIDQGTLRLLTPVSYKILWLAPRAE